jgi:plastocyanin
MTNLEQNGKTTEDQELLPVNESTFEETLEDIPDDQEKITVSSKIKIVSALLIVGIATYVAYWVQEPTDARVDVLSSTAIEGEISSETAENVLEQEIALADTSNAGNTTEVLIEDFSYTPANITIKAGTNVIWTNTDQVAHTITGDEFSSGSIRAGGSFKQFFDEPGEYTYYCAFHPQMMGKITVVASTEEAAQVGAVAEEEPLSPELLMGAAEELLGETNDQNLLHAADTAELFETEAVILDAPDFMAEMESAETGSQQLATTGPAETMYIIMLIAILALNRKKLMAIFN